MARGDLIFYHGGDDVSSRAIALGEDVMGAGADAARFTHVAVQVSDGDVRSAGDARDGLIVVEATPPRMRLGAHQMGVDDCALEGWHLRYHAATCEDALAWLIHQVGRAYGFSDIFADAARALHVPLATFDAATWDCSHTVFVYLTLAGERWLENGDAQAAAWVAAPQQVTPADLYAYCRRTAGAQATPQEGQEGGSA